MPGALIEPLFITDPYEGTLANSALGQQVIADGLTTAVEQYFGPPKQPGHPQKKRAASHGSAGEKAGTGSRRKDTKS
jgi:hypothetical protein